MSNLPTKLGRDSITNYLIINVDNLQFNCWSLVSMARLQKTVSKVSLTKNTSKRRKNMRRVRKVIKSKTPTIDDVNILLRLSELYNTAIDFEAGRMVLG